MNRFVIVLAVAVPVGLSAVGLQTPTPQVNAGAFPSDAEVHAILQQRVDAKRSAGLVVGLMEADGRTRIVAAGDPGSGQPPLDGDSVFEIGSISKVFTSTVLAELVQEGVVSLDDPVQKFVPAGVKIPSRNGKVITLGNLSEQNSGLPRMPDNFYPKDPGNPYADYTVAQLYAFVSGYKLPRDPGEQFEYSNLGVGLLGNVLTAITRQSYEDMERDRVWRPLGMSHTAIALTPWMKQHLALGHDAAGKVVANWDIPAMAGAGAIRSTTADMLKFVAANLRGGDGKLERAMAFAQQPRAPSGPNGHIGLNWLIVQPARETIVWHNGGTGGYRTFVGLVPTKHIGVVVLTNSGGAGADDIGRHLLDPAIPLVAGEPVKARVP